MNITIENVNEIITNIVNTDCNKVNAESNKIVNICPKCNKPTVNGEIVHEECAEAFNNIIDNYNSLQCGKCDCGTYIISKYNRCPVCFKTPRRIELNYHTEELKNTFKKNAEQRKHDYIKSIKEHIYDECKCSDKEYNKAHDDYILADTPNNIALEHRTDELKKMCAKRNELINVITPSPINWGELIVPFIKMIAIAGGLNFILRVYKKSICNALWGAGELLYYGGILLCIAITLFAVGFVLISATNGTVITKERKNEIKDEIQHINKDIDKLVAKMEEIEKKNNEATNTANEYKNKLNTIKELQEYIDNALENITIPDFSKEIIHNIQNEIHETLNERAINVFNNDITLNTTVDSYINKNITTDAFITFVKDKFSFIPTIELNRFINAVMNNKNITSENIKETLKYYSRLQRIINKEVNICKNNRTKEAEDTFIRIFKLYINPLNDIDVDDDYYKSNIYREKLNGYITDIKRCIPEYNIHNIKMNGFIAESTEDYIVACVSELIYNLYNSEYTNTDLWDMVDYIKICLVDFVGQTYIADAEERIAIEEAEKAYEAKVRAEELKIASKRLEEVQFQAQIEEYRARQSESENRRKEIDVQLTQLRNNATIRQMNENIARMAERQSKSDALIAEIGKELKNNSMTVNGMMLSAKGNMIMRDIKKHLEK